ncbi:MAG TPA: hypothetical protein VGJ02_03240 [Pyrinomonadaceae bacterium]
MIGRIIFIVIVFCIFPATKLSQSPSSTTTPNPEAHRWIDIDTFSISTRYRFIENANGRTNSNQQQWQLLLHGRFKFDQEGRYSVVASLASGNSLTGGWNNTGWGTGEMQTNLFPKQLYFDAKPVKTFEVQVGGIGVNNGEGTEITGYDNDTYITGERVVVRAPKSVYFDEISVTNAFLGDATHPSAFRRLKHLDRSNYHQLLVRKQISKRVGFSADYTFDSGVDTLRQAVRVKLPETRILDSLIYEDYERIDPQAGYGFALSGEKKVTQKFSLTGGLTKISHVMINSDRFPRGERLYLIGAYKLTREITVSPVIIRAVGPLLTPTTPRTRFEIVASYNILEMLHSSHVY